WWSFYGGDIAGVKKKMSYLVDLGISMIYFNPLWQAKSNHKYDSADYHSIDPHFGTTADMIEFVSLAHSQGIKIILDVAFNHTGETFWAFRDCVEKGETSPYWNWYDWKKWPLPKPLPVDFKPKDYYQCWWGIKDMPDLNYDLSRHHPEENAIRNINAAQVNAPLVSYLIDTIRWWLLDIGIDGFRLDVPDEVPFWFWELFRKEVKQAKPDAWIVGEIWHDATEWVSHRYFDSVMNYAYFKNPVIEFFILRIISCKDFIKQIETGLTLYPFHALKSMMNLLGSHDTIRVNELAKGNIARVKLAIVFQMCFVGTPHVYYGDEIALLGAKDPDNRRPFNWDWESDPVAKDLHDFYKQMILLRKSHQVLTEGDISFIPSDNGLLGFKRSFAKESLIVYLNTENQAIKIEHQEELKEVFQCGKYEDCLLHPLSAVVFVVC
ncbi:MAG: glycoside hydrolase family 13 protein, partial [Candidatus Cloacimonetes bacterium]|nr:glycoside hydrolase family 13 protein [Candidatus Cloacimonadota bacterium]